MDKKTIDQFFDSLSEDVLKEKWNKYDKYSKQENSVTISELLYPPQYHLPNRHNIKKVEKLNEYKGFKK